jgi:phosphatidylserine/phosphatidylglycerophosphate/cardiolipin synthase-like enzyme
MSEELDWFLSPRERGNPDTHLDDLALSGTAFTEGNLVTALIHGANYYRRLVEEVSALRAGDAVYFIDWRGDPDEKLLAEGPTVGELLGSAAASGVEVRGLVWRSHPQSLSFSEASNRRRRRRSTDEVARCCSIRGCYPSAPITRSC